MLKSYEPYDQEKRNLTYLVLKFNQFGSYLKQRTVAQDKIYENHYQKHGLVLLHNIVRKITKVNFLIYFCQQSFHLSGSLDSLNNKKALIVILPHWYKPFTVLFRDASSMVWVPSRIARIFFQ